MFLRPSRVLHLRKEVYQRDIDGSIRIELLDQLLGSNDIDIINGAFIANNNEKIATTNFEICPTGVGQSISEVAYKALSGNSGEQLKAALLSNKQCLIPGAAPPAQSAPITPPVNGTPPVAVSPSPFQMGSNDCFLNLAHLSTLKFLTIDANVTIKSLPPSIKELQLKNTFIKVTDLSYLSSLENLLFFLTEVDPSVPGVLDGAIPLPESIFKLNLRQLPRNIQFQLPNLQELTLTMFIPTNITIKNFPSLKIIKLIQPQKESLSNSSLGGRSSFQLKFIHIFEQHLRLLKDYAFNDAMFPLSRKPSDLSKSKSEMYKGEKLEFFPVLQPYTIHTQTICSANISTKVIPCPN
ncbi:hypothetical protein P9112_010007 [Eukaryota sp. TZLM1-RC]